MTIFFGGITTTFLPNGELFSLLKVAHSGALCLRSTRAGRREKISKLTESELEDLEKQDGSI